MRLNLWNDGQRPVTERIQYFEPFFGENYIQYVPEKGTEVRTVKYLERLDVFEFGGEFYDFLEVID